MAICYDVKQGLWKGEAQVEFLLSQWSELAAFYFIIGYKNSEKIIIKKPL